MTTMKHATGDRRLDTAAAFIGSRGKTSTREHPRVVLAVVQAVGHDALIVIGLPVGWARS